MSDTVTVQALQLPFVVAHDSSNVVGRLRQPATTADARTTNASQELQPGNDLLELDRLRDQSSVFELGPWSRPSARVAGPYAVQLATNSAPLSRPLTSPA
jgi:hypothetical protein